MNKAEIDKIADKLSKHPATKTCPSPQRTKEDIMNEINDLLRMVAERKGCKVEDLQWKRDRYGAIHIRRKKDGQS